MLAAASATEPCYEIIHLTLNKDSPETHSSRLKNEIERGFFRHVTWQNAKGRMVRCHKNFDRGF